MKTVVLFGDSNTWGFIPATEAERFPWETRWAGILQKSLGDEVRVIDEGLNGRMTAWDDPLFPNREGRLQLPMVLETHAPIDVITIMLGTNDLKHHMGKDPLDIALGAGYLVDLVLESQAGPKGNPPKVLLMCPVPAHEADCPFGPMFIDAAEKSRALAPLYKDQAARREVAFFDAGSAASCPDDDCIHLDATGHRDLAQAVIPVIQGLL